MSCVFSGNGYDVVRAHRRYLLIRLTIDPAPLNAVSRIPALGQLVEITALREQIIPPLSSNAMEPLGVTRVLDSAESHDTLRAAAGELSAPTLVLVGRRVSSVPEID